MGDGFRNQAGGTVHIHIGFSGEGEVDASKAQNTLEPGKEKGFCPDRRDIQTGKFLDKPFIDLCSFVKIVITGHSEAAL